MEVFEQRRKFVSAFGAGQPASTLQTYTARYDELWRATQDDYAALVPGSRLVVADNSDHGIPAQQPAVIIDAIAQLLRGAELGTVLDDLIAGTVLPAVGVTVFDGNQILETAVTGVRRRGDPTPVELTDKFSIGSNAKAMTATLVATYLDEGVISWETTVAEVYSDALPNLDNALAQVTFRQLLSHTSGLYDELAFLPLQEIDEDRPIIEQRFEVARISLTRPGQHPAGQYLYSNVGYTLVGAMLEELTGTPFEELVQARVFDALGMDSCGFYAPGTPGEVDQPWGHLDERGGEPIDPGHPESDFPHVLAPAGLVHCNMADWTLFLQSQLRGFQGSEGEIISPEAFVTLQNTAGGLRIRTWPGHHPGAEWAHHFVPPRKQQTIHRRSVADPGREPGPTHSHEPRRRNGRSAHAASGPIDVRTLRELQYGQGRSKLMTNAIIDTATPETATQSVVAVDGLTKRYGSAVAVDSVSFDVPAGEVIGLLGPNGAGKTTAMKMLLGLVKPTSGRASVLGAEPGSPEFAHAIQRVGALIESPALYERLSGRRNLELQARTLGVSSDPARIDELLELVDLRHRANDQARTYSLGMKQRLGIAVAMIGRPELVILDEPANGLDPAGIVDIRHLLRRLPDMGTTVLVSSHQLAEVQQACDRVLVLDHGRLIASGTTGEILSGHSSRDFTVRLDPAELTTGVDRLRDQSLSVVSATIDSLTLVLPDGWSGRDIKPHPGRCRDLRNRARPANRHPRGRLPHYDWSKQ